MDGRRLAKLALAAGAIALLTAAPPRSVSAQDRPVLVFAATSLKEALDEVVALWRRETGKRATVSYAASSALARQIESGAPAELFVSADLDWMDYLEQRHLIRAESRVNLLANSLVLVAPRDSVVRVTIAPGFDLARLLGGGLLAMANTDAVPAGKYGKGALQKLEAWEAVKGKVVQTDNVRAALMFVARGEAPLGIVYKTDAMADRGVRIVGAFPENAHPAIVYPAALLRDAGRDGAALLAFIRSPAARPVFEKRGFVAAQD